MTFLKIVSPLNAILLAFAILPLSCTPPPQAESVQLQPVQLTPSTLSITLNDNNYRILGISQDSKGAMWFLSSDMSPEFASSYIFTFDGTNWVKLGDFGRIYPEMLYHDSKANTYLLHDSLFNNNALIYDGKSLYRSNLVLGKYPQSFTESNLGNVWWKDDSNINCFNGTHVIKIPRLPLPQGYQVDFSAVLEDKNGNDWFATSYGIWRYSNNKWENIGSLNRTIAWDLDIDKKGVIWASISTMNFTSPNPSIDDSLVYLGGNNDTWVRPDLAIRSEANRYTDNSIVRDSNGNLWVLALKDGVFEFDGTNWKHFLIDDGLLSNENRIFADSKGNVWVVPVDTGSENSSQFGVCRFDGTNWQKFGVQDGLPSKGIISIFNDQSGFIWFGTTNGTVYRFSPN